MFSNLPTMLQDQDFRARHADILAAARSGRTVDPKAVVWFEGPFTFQVLPSGRPGKPIYVYDKATRTLKIRVGDRFS